MILYIAEKPSLGRAIANGLSSKQKKGDGFITLDNGDVVSWCIGHLLEQAEPDKYDDRYKKWQFADLPIIPEQWKLIPKAQTKKQLAVLRKLVKQASHLVNAGDPDREGQLLVDEVISYLGVKGVKFDSVQRLLISDLNIAAVKKALVNLQSNKTFRPLSASALARSRADWLYGMNMTRAYTLIGQQAGYHGVLSVGRVQTPVLGLVVRRDQEIKQFTPTPYYDVVATLQTTQQEEFEAKWQPSKACEKYQDDQGRVIFRKLAQTVVERTQGQAAKVLQITEQSKRQNAPLPFNLSSLQIDAAKKFNLNAKQVLDICQALYEKHQLITYPRSDCRHLPVAHFKEATRVCESIKHNCPDLSHAVDNANLTRKSKAWDDKKVSAHHAIIPTDKKYVAANLSGTENKVYQLIVLHYLAQFYPPFNYQQQQVDVDIAGGLFTAKAKQVVEQGWKVLFKSDANESFLPKLKEGESLHCLKSSVLDKVTEPPKHFTDATLLAAMTGIARYVQDPEIKKVLKETDGLGTEATRASIIELLFKRHFLHKQGKQILATEAGVALITALPVESTTPDMTALWESKLNAIAGKELQYQAFMQPLEASLTPLVASAALTSKSVFQGLKSMPKPVRKGKRKFTKKKPTRTRSG
ncbi:DNA topoisomerase III [Psychrobium sp. 1_MG-2023]|uniref:DNA topoisomerase III n=1 Tax=Psychrobium sp. 1_MG-2023 TaxID=3062624 RepID=UPI0027350F5F|nr:DNA topoisomerase III [Psychrobium sp. 1_MG-2023]MDP2560533.1 DNA topoisomerase III [Psychrobium sp. 1_MG-2023]